MNESKYDIKRVLINIFQYRDVFFPRRMAIELTEFCNRSCSYCPNSLRPTPKILISDDVFDGFVARIKEINWTGMVSYNGYGEPLTVPKLAAYVARVSQEVPRAISCIYTNGDYLTTDKARALLAAGTHHMMVTRHPPFSNNWDKNIQEVQHHFPDKITVRTLRPDQIQNPAGLLDFKTSPFSRCHLPSVGLTICVDGCARFCCSDYNKEYLVGNIKDKSIKELWYDEHFKKIRKHLLFGKADLKICRRCMSGGHDNPSAVKNILAPTAPPESGRRRGVATAPTPGRPGDDARGFAPPPS